MVSNKVPQIVLGVVFLLLLAACGFPDLTLKTETKPEWEATPEIVVEYLGPTLSPVVEFTDGEIAIPNGYALYVELMDDDRLLWECEPPPVEECDPGFDYSSDHRLSGEISTRTLETNPILVALANANMYSCRQLAMAEQLPYSIPYSSAEDMEPSAGPFVLRSVKADGSVVLDVDSRQIVINPGESWTRKITTAYNPYSPDCATDFTTAHTFINHGLLRHDQLDLKYWDGVAYREVHPGMPQPTPVVPLFCTVFQPLGSIGWIWDIEIAADGSVWVAANNGVARLETDTESWTTYSQANGLVEGSIRGVTADSDGSVWIISWEGKVVHFDGENWTPYTTTDGLVSDDVLQVSIAPDSTVWFATRDGVSHWDRETDAWTSYTKEDGLSENSVEDILFTPDGRIWFADYEVVTSLLPGRVSGEDDLWETFQDPRGDYETAAVAPDGSIWFSGQRFFDVVQGKWIETVYDRFVYDLAVDSRGGIWIARGNDIGAIYIPDPLKSPQEDWIRYGTDNGLAGDDIRSLALESDSVVWFGSENASVTRCEINR